MVKLKLPPVEGVPCRNHCLVDAGEVMERPGGRAPASIVLDGGPLLEQTPPVVTSCWLYEAPAVAGGRESLTICSVVDWASNEAPVKMTATARIPRVYLAVITYYRSFTPDDPVQKGR